MSKEFSAWVETPSQFPDALIGFYDSQLAAVAASEIFTSNGNDVIIKGPGKYTPDIMAIIIGRK